MTDTGAYIKVSDRLPEHPKIIAVGGDAGWLYICALGYASRNLTNGFIPAIMVPRLSDRRQSLRLAAALVEARLWHRNGHDCGRCPQPKPSEFVIHDYLEHQRSAERVREISATRAVSGARGGSNSHANGNQEGSNLLQLSFAGTEANTSQEPGDHLPAASDGTAPARRETPGQRANRLAAVYTDRVPLSNFPAVAKIVRKAINADCTDEEITAGLGKVAGENRSLTTEALRVAMCGPPRTVATTDQRVADILALKSGFQDDHRTPPLKVIPGSVA